MLYSVPGQRATSVEISCIITIIFWSPSCEGSVLRPYIVLFFARVCRLDHRILDGLTKPSSLRRSLSFQKCQESWCVHGLGYIDLAITYMYLPFLPFFLLYHSNRDNAKPSNPPYLELLILSPSGKSNVTILTCLSSQDDFIHPNAPPTPRLKHRSITASHSPHSLTQSLSLSLSLSLWNSYHTLTISTIHPPRRTLKQASAKSK